MKDDNNTTTKAPDRIAELITERYELLKAGALTPETDAAIRRAAIDEVSMERFGFLEGNYLLLDMTTYVQRIKDLAPLQITIHDVFKGQTRDVLFSECLREFQQDNFMRRVLKRCLKCFTDLEVKLLELHRGADPAERSVGHHGAVPVLDPSRLRTVDELIRRHIDVYGSLSVDASKLIKSYLDQCLEYLDAYQPKIRHAFDWTAFVEEDGTVVRVLEKGAPFRILAMNVLTKASNSDAAGDTAFLCPYDYSDVAMTIAPCDEEGHLITWEDGSTLSWVIRERDFQHLDHDYLEYHLAELKRKMAGR